MPEERDRADHVIEPEPEAPAAPITDIASKEAIIPVVPNTGSPATNESDTDQPVDPVDVLAQIRSLLGPDPRVGELEARISELERQLTAEKHRADEAEARLALINDALSA